MCDVQLSTSFDAIKSHFLPWSLFCLYQQKVLLVKFSSLARIYRIIMEFVKSKQNSICNLSSARQMFCRSHTNTYSILPRLLFVHIAPFCVSLQPSLSLSLFFYLPIPFSTALSLSSHWSPPVIIA